MGFRTFQGYEETRHIISCQEDISVWRKILENIEGFPVYTTEIILVSVLKQEVDWDGSRVPGSEDIEVLD